MLRKADNASIHRGSSLWGLITGREWVTLQVGKLTYSLGKMTGEEWESTYQGQLQTPYNVLQIGDRNYWEFQDRIYWEDEDLTQPQVHALLITRQQRRNAEIQRAEQIVAMGSGPRPPVQRGSIPDDVKHFVWTRDGGRCCQCSSNVELQFDHVIPVSMGGSSDPQNLQILCGPCNRRKGARVS